MFMGKSLAHNYLNILAVVTITISYTFVNLDMATE